MYKYMGVKELWHSRLQCSGLYGTLIIFQGTETTCSILCHENITGYLKNHWTKHRHVCTHIDAFCMLIPNLGIKYTQTEFCKKKFRKIHQNKIIWLVVSISIQSVIVCVNMMKCCISDIVMYCFQIIFLWFMWECF